MIQNRKECSKAGKVVLKLAILSQKVCESAIAHRTAKKGPHARTSHTFQNGFRTHTFDRTLHVCARTFATHTLVRYNFSKPWQVSNKADEIIWAAPNAPMSKFKVFNRFWTGNSNESIPPWEKVYIRLYGLYSGSYHHSRLRCFAPWVRAWIRNSAETSLWAR